MLSFINYCYVREIFTKDHEREMNNHFIISRCTFFFKHVATEGKSFSFCHVKRRGLYLSTQTLEIGKGKGTSL